MRKVSAKHIQWLNKELPVLESEGVLSDQTAADIKDYYRKQTASGLHWAVIAFAVLGTLLIGSGIILLFAHNWDALTRPTRAVLSFAPLTIGALLSCLALIKNGGPALREAAGLFHALAVGASIALIGQTYHLPANTPAFLLSWSLLIVPLIFILRSTGVYLLYLGLIWGWSTAAQQDYGQAAGYWLLIIPPIVRLASQVKKNRYAPDALISFFGILLALCLSLGFVFERTLPGLWIVAYSALLSAAGLIGIHYYKESEGFSNPPKTVGLIGISVLAYLFTWTFFWDEIGWDHYRSSWSYRPWGNWLDGGITFLLLTGWAAAAVKAFRRDSFETILLSAFPLISGGCFLLCSTSNQFETACALLFNSFLLLFGLMYIILGCRNTKLRQLNGGMMVLSVLLVTRFFDTDFGFLAKGLVFITLGICFLSVNLVMARRKKHQEVAS